MSEIAHNIMNEMMTNYGDESAMTILVNEARDHFHDPVIVEKFKSFLETLMILMNVRRANMNSTLTNFMNDIGTMTGSTTLINARPSFAANDYFSDSSSGSAVVDIPEVPATVIRQVDIPEVPEVPEVPATPPRRRRTGRRTGPRTGRRTGPRTSRRRRAQAPFVPQTFRDQVDITVKCGQCQSGKTTRAIVAPILENMRNDKSSVLVIPPNLTLSSQTKLRLKEAFEDEGLNPDDILVCDSGEKNPSKRYGRQFNSLPIAINRGPKAVILLSNTEGSTCLEEICEGTSGDKAISVIIDEVHTVFSDKVFDKLERNLRNSKLDVTGVTATAVPVKREDITMNCEIIEAPDCYIGYNDIHKEIYRPSDGDIFERIIRERETGTVTICHAGFRKSQHQNAADNWLDLCQQAGKQGAAIIINSEGVSAETTDNEPVQTRGYGELWELVHRVRQSYPYLGIFGDQCMKESITFQKCTTEVNSPVNDIVVVKDMTVSMVNCTGLIQKIGRICGNDTSGEDNQRTIWMTEKIQESLVKGFMLEDIVQSNAHSTLNADIEYVKERKKAENLARKIQEKVNSPYKSFTERNLRTKYTRWKNLPEEAPEGSSVVITKISKAFKSIYRTILDQDEISPITLIDIIKDTNFEKPDLIMKDLTWCDKSGSRLFIVNSDGNLNWIEERREMIRSIV